LFEIGFPRPLLQREDEAKGGRACRCPHPFPLPLGGRGSFIINSLQFIRLCFLIPRGAYIRTGIRCRGPKPNRNFLSGATGQTSPLAGSRRGIVRKKKGSKFHSKNLARATNWFSPFKIARSRFTPQRRTGSSPASVTDSIWSLSPTPVTAFSNSSLAPTFGVRKNCAARKSVPVSRTAARIE
jgi:hypothetical protein